jgi:hypothetical protein
LSTFLVYQVERKLQGSKNSFFAFGQSRKAGQEIKFQNCKGCPSKADQKNERRGEISVCGACGKSPPAGGRKRRQFLFNSGAILQQSSDLFYQKFLKIKSQISSR